MAPYFEAYVPTLKNKNTMTAAAKLLCQNIKIVGYCFPKLASFISILPKQYRLDTHATLAGFYELC